MEKRQVWRCLVVAGAKGEVPQELAHLLAQPAKRAVAELRAPDQPRVGPAGQSQWAASRDAEPRRQSDAPRLQAASPSQPTTAERLL